MKSRTLVCIAAMTLFAPLAIPVQLAAQDNEGHHRTHHHYKLIDMGTFGGPNSSVREPDQGFQAINNQGIVVGGADTANPDPNFLNNDGFFPVDGFIIHAFQWQKNVLTDLGALPGGNNSFAGWISANGLIAGSSENGVIDPQFGVPQADAVLWKEGKIINIATAANFTAVFPAARSSGANAVNNWGQVVGDTINVTDQCEAYSLPFCRRAFLWQNGFIQDLGTLGGPEASAIFVNDRGQVAGQSYTSSTPNASTGIPTQQAFIWDNGSMRGLTLGGTIAFTQAFNNRGQVVGGSTLPGDLVFHPFLWDRGVLIDLGTFGGTFGEPRWINDNGEIVGKATNQDGAFLAFLWRNGVMSNLGTLDGDPWSEAFHINSKGQVVGAAQDLSGEWVDAFLWQDGGPIINLNTVIPANSGVRLISAPDINDRGEITALGIFPNGNQHAFLLIPCGQGTEGCGSDAASATTTKRNNSTLNVAQRLAIRRIMARFNTRFAQRYHIPGLGASPRD
jgi:probable HAF family extracellular repeat protein